jgi:hypothetical protein
MTEHRKENLGRRARRGILDLSAFPWYEAVTHASREAIAAVAEVKVYDPFFLANGRDGSLWEHMP